jgi:pimeloyl-ACP methyl ester carboxylesterase
MSSVPSSLVDLGPCAALLDRPEASSRLVVLPGARYTVQAPLLWFAREVALAHGAGVLAVQDSVPEDDDPFAWAQDRARRALDHEPAACQVVVGKSLASAAAGLVAQRGLAALWLTPLLDQPVVLEGLARVSAPTLLLGGGADPTWRPSAPIASELLEVVELPGLDHSLQVPGDPAASLEALDGAVAIIARHLGATLAP